MISVCVWLSMRRVVVYRVYIGLKLAMEFEWMGVNLRGTKTKDLRSFIKLKGTLFFNSTVRNLRKIRLFVMKVGYNEGFILYSVHY